MITIKKPIAIVNYYGGLGNQMFMYALARSLPNRAVRLRFRGYGHGDDLIEVYNTSLRKLNKAELMVYSGHELLLRVIGSNTAAEEKSPWEYDEKAMQGNITDLYGYRQNINYFRDNLPILRREFTPRKERSEKVQSAIQTVRSSQSIAVHIRRGDYLNNDNKNIFYSIPLSYYQKAIALLSERLSSPQLFVFSDDIPWCKQNFTGYDNIVFIDEAYSDSTVDDLEIMKNCHHFIIANSTFSWWAALLSETDSEKTIIAPQRWFNDDAANSEALQGLSIPGWILME